MPNLVILAHFGVRSLGRIVHVAPLLAQNLDGVGSRLALVFVLFHGLLGLHLYKEHKGYLGFLWLECGWSICSTILSGHLDLTFLGLDDNLVHGAAVDPLLVGEEASLVILLHFFVVSLLVQCSHVGEWLLLFICHFTPLLGTLSESFLVGNRFSFTYFLGVFSDEADVRCQWFLWLWSSVLNCWLLNFLGCPLALLLNYLGRLLVLDSVDLASYSG